MKIKLREECFEIMFLIILQNTFIFKCWFGKTPKLKKKYCVHLLYIKFKIMFGPIL